MPAIDPVFAVALRGATALLLLRAALHKVRDADGFRSALAGYAILPVRLEAMAARVLPALEFTAAILLVGPKTAHTKCKRETWNADPGYKESKHS